MAVTEFAILTSTSGDISPALRQHITEALPVQQAWHERTFPDSPSDRVERGGAVFRQAEDPAKILITTRWDSVEAHWAWIASEENRRAMGSITEHIFTEGKSGVVLFHLGAEIFSLLAPGGKTGLLESPVISVARMFVGPGRRGTFQAAFERARGGLEGFVGQHVVRGGWRVEKDVGWDGVEFVLFCGWDHVARHRAFADDPGFEAYKTSLEVVTETEVKHYRRFL